MSNDDEGLITAMLVAYGPNGRAAQMRDALRVVRAHDAAAAVLTERAAAGNAATCRRCSECGGEEHHWIESAAFAYKHCPAMAAQCDGCEAVATTRSFDGAPLCAECREREAEDSPAPAPAPADAPVAAPVPVVTPGEPVPVIDLMAALKDALAPAPASPVVAPSPAPTCAHPPCDGTPLVDGYCAEYQKALVAFGRRAYLAGQATHDASAEGVLLAALERIRKDWRPDNKRDAFDMAIAEYRALAAAVPGGGK